MKSWLIIFALFAWTFDVAKAEDVIYCNSTSQCPEDYPCCSQYGQCGRGSYCLGGCDIRFSYNLSSCMPMPIMDEFNTSFTSIDIIEKQTSYLGNASETDWVYTGYIAEYDDKLMIQMPNQTTGTVVSSSKYLWYGKVSARMKTSRTQGVVTAFILFSDVQDEIDYEFVGADLLKPQTNYYHQGILNYTNARNVSTSDTFENWHTYELDWNEDRIEWSIDGEVLRTLNKADTWNSTTNVYDYPQTPTRIQFSLWPAGAASNGIGTISWAGGAINWDAEDIQKYDYFYGLIDYCSYTPYDLPSDVLTVGTNKSSKANVFMYNSTEGNAKDIYLTHKKTWLGSSDAVGFDPDNEDKVVTTVVSSGKSKVTKTSTKKASINTSTNKVPTMTTTGTGTGADSGNQAVTTGAEGQTIEYSSGDGFVQNFNTKNGYGQSSSSALAPANDALNAIATMLIGLLSYFI